MIILIYGNDELKSRAKYQSLVGSLLAKNPEASLFKLEAENFRIENLEELTKSQGLFYQKFIVEVDNLFSSDEDQAKLAQKFLNLMAESANVFILLENHTDEEVLTEIKKLATKEQEFSKKEAPAKKNYGGVDGYNIFSITDAFTAKNKNRAWALYHEAQMVGISSEEIFWKLIWAVNNLLLVKNTKEVSKLKMKPYPLAKATASAKAFSNEELKKISTSFLDLYHQNYLGTDEFEFGLEKIILSV